MALNSYAYDHPKVYDAVVQLRESLAAKFKDELTGRSKEIEELTRLLDGTKQKLKNRTDNSHRIVEKQLLKLVGRHVDQETARTLVKKQINEAGGRK